jgi:hypothetical protein
MRHFMISWQNIRSQFRDFPTVNRIIHAARHRNQLISIAQIVEIIEKFSRKKLPAMNTPSLSTSLELN